MDTTDVFLSSVCVLTMHLLLASETHQVAAC